MSFGDLKVQDLIYEDSSNNEITVVIADLATKANPTFTGTVTVPTATAGDNSTKAASTAFVVASFAPKAAPAFTGNATGVNLTLSGNLTVNGTTTTIDTTTLQVEDKNIEIGKVSSPSDTTADGGGWSLLGATTKTFNWVNATDAWTSSEHIHIPDDKKLLIGTGSDLSIYHSSSNSQNTIKSINGRINFNAAETRMEGADGSELIGRFIENGAVELYHNNVKVFNTDGNGIMVKGPEGGTANIYLYADEGDENADKFQLTVNDGGPFHIQNRASGGVETNIKCFGEGAVELYHDNSKKIETTSGGVNVIGALTINGAALSAAPEVSLVADGAISDNVSCNITSSGKVQAVTASAAASNFVLSNQDATYSAFTYDTEHKLFCWWFNDRSDDALKVMVGTPSGTGASQTITWGSAQTLYTDSQGASGGYQNYRYIGAAYSPGTKFHMICWRPSGVWSIAVKINSSGSVTTKGSPNHFTGGSGNSIGNVAITIVPTRGDTSRMSVFYKGPSSGNAQVKYREVTITTSNGATTETGEIGIMPNGNWTHHSLWHDTTNDNTLVGATYNGGGLYYGLIYSGGDTQTQITGSTSDTRPAICHDPVSDRVIFFYVDLSDGGSSSDLRYKIGTYNSGKTSVSWGSEQTAITNNVSNAGYSGDMNNYITYDSLNKKFYLAYRQYSPAKVMLLPFTVNSGGDGIDTETSIELYSAGWNRLTPYADSTTGNIYIGLTRPGGDSSGAGESEGAVVTHALSSTSVTTENFLGWSAAAASDGNTATIKVTGNTVTGLSGLTPGKTYYVQSNGSVGLTPINGKTVEAGVALTSSSLLIR